MLLQFQHQNYLINRTPTKFQSHQAYRSDSTDDELDIRAYFGFDQSNSKFRTQNVNLKFTEPKLKYKTEMCKNFSEKGYCNYRNKCQYAHGYNQLTFSMFPSNKSYRTKKCKSFWENGVCSYGIRCQFSHYAINFQTRLFLKMNEQLMNKDDKMDGSSSRFVWGHYKDVE